MSLPPDLAALRALATAARDAVGSDWQQTATLDYIGSHSIEPYLVACSPERIIALCDALERSQADSKRLDWLETESECDRDKETGEALYRFEWSGDWAVNFRAYLDALIVANTEPLPLTETEP